MAVLIVALAGCTTPPPPAPVKQMISAPAPVRPKPVVAPVRPPRITPNTDISAELKRLWEKASPVERKAFLESMTPPPCELTAPVPAP